MYCVYCRATLPYQRATVAHRAQIPKFSSLHQRHMKALAETGLVYRTLGTVTVPLVPCCPSNFDAQCAVGGMPPLSVRSKSAGPPCPQMTVTPALVARRHSVKCSPHRRLTPRPFRRYCTGQYSRVWLGHGLFCQPGLHTAPTVYCTTVYKLPSAPPPCTAGANWPRERTRQSATRPWKCRSLCATHRL